MLSQTQTQTETQTRPQSQLKTQQVTTNGKVNMVPQQKQVIVDAKVDIVPQQVVENVFIGDSLQSLIEDPDFAYDAPEHDQSVDFSYLRQDDVENMTISTDEKDIKNDSALLVNDGGEVYELRTSFESLSGGTHTFEYWCLDSKPLNDMFLGFESDLRKAREDLSVARESNDAAGIKKAEASIKKTTSDINKSENDPALREAYKLNDQKTAFTGYKVTRKDAKCRATNLSGAADTIEIETRGLGEEHTLRIVMPGGETLQLGVGKDGNWNGEVLFLTKFGAKVPHKFTGQEDDKFFADNAKSFENRGREGIFYNRYDDIIAELDKMNGINFNGKNILGKIREQVAGQTMQDNSFSTVNGLYRTQTMLENKTKKNRVCFSAVME